MNSTGCWRSLCTHRMGTTLSRSVQVHLSPSSMHLPVSVLKGWGENFSYRPLRCVRCSVWLIAGMLISSNCEGVMRRYSLVCLKPHGDFQAHFMWIWSGVGLPLTACSTDLVCLKSTMETGIYHTAVIVWLRFMLFESFSTSSALGCP